MGSAFGRELDVTAVFALQRAPRRAQCSAYTTRACIDVSCLARLCLRLALVSVSRRAKRRHSACRAHMWHSACLRHMWAVSHKHFHCTRWKRLALEMICLTLPRQMHGLSNAGRNCGTTSRMCAAKESRGYLSARSSTRCMHAANCCIASPLGVTLVMRKSRRVSFSSNAKVTELKETRRIEQFAEERERS